MKKIVLDFLFLFVALTGELVSNAIFYCREGALGVLYLYVAFFFYYKP